jgi:beta-glucosidase
LPVTFYEDTKDLPPFTDYSFKNRTYRYYTGKTLWGFGYGLSYSKFSYGPVQLPSSVAAGKSVTATVTVANASDKPGDEVVEAYLKTPQADGPVRSLVGFKRVHLEAGEHRDVSLTLTPRSLSSVDDKGERSILPGAYHLTLGGAQPGETTAVSEGSFTITGSQGLPK